MSINPVSSRQTRLGALTAIQTHLDSARDAALEMARAAHFAATGRHVDYPEDGPVCPSCDIDDSSDVTFETKSDVNPTILRRLGIVSTSARRGDIVNAGFDEPSHNHELEWVVVSPNQYGHNTGRNIFNRGIAEIEAVLAPLRDSHLTHSPEAGSPQAALSFDFPNAEFLTFDLGEHFAFSASITLELTLDALSVLS